MKSSWKIKELHQIEISDKELQSLGINEILAEILSTRGIITPEEIDFFINPRINQMHSPFLLSGLKEAVERIKSAVTSNEKIGIFADSDLDGITSLALLHDLFKRLGVEIFHRSLKDDEGYGLTCDIIGEFISNKVNLIITADSGIRDIDEIAFAKKNGIDVIVTDHHTTGDNVPDAIIVNPKKSDCLYPYKELAGVGVAFKLALGLLISYLPFYGKKFAIVDFCNGKFTLTRVSDMISYQTEFFESEDEIINSAEGFDFILCNGIEKIETISNHTNSPVYSFSDFACQFVKPESNNINSIAKSLNINSNIFASRSDLLAKILISLTYSASPKIADFISRSMELVAIGSIADIMPMTGENRIFVINGLKALESTGHFGLSTLLGSETIDMKKIGWDLAPLLNSPGRFGRSELTVKFFLETDRDEISKTISAIKSVNNERKASLRSSVDSVIADIDSGIIETDKDIIMLGIEKVPEGISGLVAGRIAEKFGKPVLLCILPGKNGMVKGSGRSEKDFNFFDFIQRFSPYFERIGGHAQAFGFTISDRNIAPLFNAISTELKKERLGHDDDILEIDYELQLKKIDLNFIESLQRIEPYGRGNENPFFLTKELAVKSFSRFGTAEKHGRFSFEGNSQATAIGWNMADLMNELYIKKCKIDLVYTLEINNFNGGRYARMIIKDISEI